ncbi:hypothetical protein FL966_06035 [Caproiciproducens galactitolivorans]|uniref:Uncharacterized protein n=1 Tax=Caproiciproducens galactitolivorans TaxID=642589 RepID=A0A4Z0YG08_9FIRM|nr:hypothetical protein [Caproiciproducens galactitolivorans]QEY34648.1 hypothetical protein FL966_06035 [Caproiciproducens galactitolivorans]TGJ75882.1 hypothetical protein CAGA_20900 [Caproiciproducens galactitolivorans]
MTDNYQALITIPATDCNFISTLGRAGNDELTKAEEYLRTHPFANKTRLKAVQREIRKREKK